MYHSYPFLRFFTCILGVLIASLASKSQQLTFNSWTTEAGLSQNSVLAISEDKEGYIWIGTGNGLNRFDGKEFKIYNLPPDLPATSGKDVTALFADKQHRLWIGTNTGLLLYDISKSIFTKVTIDKKLSSFITFCIYEDKKGHLWIGTSKGLYYTKATAAYSFEKFGNYGAAGFEDERIRCVFDEGNGYLWVGSNAGATRVKRTPQGDEYRTFKHDPLQDASLSSNIVTAITADSYHHIWIGTQSKGINLFDKNTGSFTRIDKQSGNHQLINDHIRTIKPDNQGYIWVGTQEGISKINGATKAVYNYQNDPMLKNSLSQNSIHSIFIDRNRLVWIGTFFGGINLVNPFPTNFRVWQNNGSSSGLSNNVIGSITADTEGNLWIGTEGGGLNYYDKQSQKFTYYLQGANSIGSNLVKTTMKDSDGNIWIGTHAGGLNLYQNGRFTKYFTTPDNAAFLRSEISTIAEDQQKNLWLGFQGNLQDLKIYKREGIELTDISDQFDRSILKGKNIKKVFADSKKNIWIATGAGLYVVKKDESVVKSIEQLVKLPEASNAHITSFQEDAKGNIWFGIEKNGLKNITPQPGRCVAILSKPIHQKIPFWVYWRIGKVISGLVQVMDLLSWTQQLVCFRPILKQTGFLPMYLTTMLILRTRMVYFILEDTMD